MPKVSVLVPIYKTNERYLREAIESVLAQSFSDFELLLLDDCPDDSREAVVRSYTDPRIRYEKNPRNLGITPSRNRLMEMARGEYFAIFDHDDVCVPTRLEKEVAYLDAHPECGMVSGYYQMIPSGELHDGAALEDHEIRVKLMGINALSHSASMLRASVIRDHHIRYQENASPCEDYALCLQLLPYTQFHNLPEVMIRYRSHESNTSGVQSARMYEKGYMLRAIAHARFPELAAEYDALARRIVRITFLGLPVMKIVQWGRMRRYYLFHAIPILTLKYIERL